MNPAATEHRDTPGLRFIRLLRPYTWYLSLILGLLFLLTFVDMGLPFAVKLLVDNVFPHKDGSGGDWSLLWWILPGLGVIYLARNALFYASRLLSLWVSEDLCFFLRRELFEHLQQLSLRFYRSHQPGKVSARLMDDTFKIQTFIQDKFPTFLRYTFEFQVLLVILYVVNFRLAIASTIILPLHFLVYKIFRVPIRSSHSEAQENIAAAHGNVVEKFLGIEVVKGFSGEDRESVRFRKAIDASRSSTIRSQKFHFAQKVAADLVVGLGTVLLLGYGAWEVARGRMTGGAFLMFFMYVKMLYPAVLEVISGLGHLSKCGASVDRVFEMLDEPVDDVSTGSAEPIDLEEFAGQISFSHVNFAYEEDHQVLHDISLDIQPGEHVIISGPSGSGKSSLLSLLPRFNDPVSGTVQLDGRDLSQLQIRDVRRIFGMVFQEVFLFNTSIEENLRYARSDATFDEMVEACRITGAHEFIERLPDGYNTKFGSFGGELSRGEKQRLTLARALIKNPRVLLLDEATASIDSQAAREIISAIFDLMEGRTVIMVTHDVELLDFADQVIIVDEGCVTFAGPPDALPETFFSQRHSSSPIVNDQVTDKLGTTKRGDSQPPPTSEMPSQTQTNPPAPRSSSSSSVTRLSLLAALFSSVFVMSSCIHKDKTDSSFEMEEPRISDGVFVEENDPDRLRKLADALDQIALDPPVDSLPELPDSAANWSLDDPLAPPDAQSVALAEMSLEDAAGVEAGIPLPPNSAQISPLPKMSETELRELMERLTLKFTIEQGYKEGAFTLADVLPQPPRGVVPLLLLTRGSEQGTHVLRIGYRQFVSQPPQLWSMGIIIQGDSLTRNPDLDFVIPTIDPLVASMNEMRTNLTTVDLESKLIQLSYVDVPTAMPMLKGLGINAIDNPTAVPQTLEFAQLPIVISIPDPAANMTGLLGQGSTAKGEFGVTLTPSLAAALPPNTVASPMTQLLVLFHPAHPEQFSRVRRLLDEYIDRPARQIFLEGMVLEISEDGLRDLGVEWELEQGPITFRTGSMDAGTSDETLYFESTDLDFHRVFTRDFLWMFEGRIRALIRDGKAEILARPSVLTLNNRQSVIRVGQDIPIATSTEGYAANANRINFSFKYLPTGILLNVRPRINEEGDEVSMLVDTIVSSRVPNADLELRSTDGELLASAPTVSTRRVQTYARITNNTPFIIGGLVLHENTTTHDKVPLLGDIPILGALFRSENTEKNKTEVIIVLTPNILPEDSMIARTTPRDVDIFDSFDNELFRDAYRIRTEDVYDLSFLFDNRRLNQYRALAQQAIEQNFRLAETEPFSYFAHDIVPGEEILVSRMMYEVVKRLEIDDEIRPERLIFFEGQQVGGYDVKYLDLVMSQFVGGMSYRGFFRNMTDKALALTFYYDRDIMQEGRLASEPIPELSIVDCAGRKEWGDILWELNQPLPDGRERFTILLHSEKDMVRLKRAVALKHIIWLNGGRSQLLLRNFSVGKVLFMPDLKPTQAHVIDADVARFFFYTEHYYAATFKIIEQRLKELDTAIREMGGQVESPKEVELGEPES